MTSISIRAGTMAAMVWLGASVCAAAQVVKQDVPGIRNFAKVESTVACAGAITVAPCLPQEDGLRLHHQPAAGDRAGRRRRPPHRRSAKAAGIQYFHIPFSATTPDPAAVDAFLKVITTPGFSRRSFIQRAVEEPPGCGS